jgi:hypothetical protein
VVQGQGRSPAHARDPEGTLLLCGWRARWAGWNIGWDHKNPRWVCYHEEFCTTCGKITRHTLEREECPHYYEFNPDEAHQYLPKSLY